jgi:stress-induced morphogen
MKLPRSMIRKDAQVERVRAVLEKTYRKDHPDAVIDVYKRNQFSIRIRIIDPSFADQDDIQREERIWKILKQLPNETFTNITMLVCLTPEEMKDSFINDDFENPQPSQL